MCQKGKFPRIYFEDVDKKISKTRLNGKIGKTAAKLF